MGARCHTAHGKKGKWCWRWQLLLLLLPTLLPPGSYTRLISTLLITGQWVMSQVKPRRVQEGRVKACRQAQRWCERKGRHCCGWRRLGRHVPRASLSFTFRMMLDRCGDSAARGEGGAMSKESAGGSVVAYTGRVTVVMAGGWESTQSPRRICTPIHWQPALHLLKWYCVLAF